MSDDPTDQGFARPNLPPYWNWLTPIPSEPPKPKRELTEEDKALHRAIERVATAR